MLRLKLWYLVQATPCIYGMKGILERLSLHSKNDEKADKPSLEFQLLDDLERGSKGSISFHHFLQLVEEANFAKLQQEVTKTALQLRQLMGEELHHLSIEELHQLEKSLEAGSKRVVAKKDEIIMKEIIRLQEKEMQLTEENTRLRQNMVKRSNSQKQIHTYVEKVISEEDRQSSESITNNCKYACPLQDYESSDTLLTLGLSLSYTS